MKMLWQKTFKLSSFLYQLENGAEITDPTVSQLEDVRSIKVTLLAVAGRFDRDFTNNITYYPRLKSGWRPFRKEMGTLQ